MANRIKGITIEIGGDTTKLSSAMKEADSAIKKTQTSLKDVNKLLKLDPKNTELLKQKQELLANQVSETKDRLTQLKEAQSQMETSGVDKSSDAYKALQREIIETQNKLTEYQKEQKEFGNVTSQLFKEVGSDVKKAGEKMSETGDKIAQKVTVPLVAVGTAATAAFTQWDNGVDTIVTKTGASGEALDEMTESMNNLAKNIPTTFEKAGEAIGEVETRFGLTGQALEDLSGQYIKFAEINNTDVTSSIDGTQQALSAFHLGADKAGALLDMLTSEAQLTGADVGTLTSELISNATAFQGLGINIGESIMVLGDMEMAGIDASDVLKGLSKVQQNAAKDGKSMQDTLGQAVSSMSDAIDIFGAKAGPKLYEAFSNGTLSVDEFAASATGTDGLTDTLGTVSNTFDGTLDPIDQWQMTMNAAIPVLADVGNTIMEIVQPGLEKLSDGISKVKDWWDNLDPSMQQNIITIGLVLAAIGPVISILGKVVSGIGSVISFIGFLMSPMGLVVAAIVAIIAIIVVLAKNWDDIKAKTKEVWDKIQNYINSACDSVKQKWDGIKDWFQQKWDGIVNSVSGLKDKIMSPFRDAWNGIQGLFSGTISLPHIKLPHFSISGSLNPLNWLKSGTPSISVQWYKKAMEHPYTFNQPTLIGVGEAGSETVVGTEWLKNHTGGTTVTNNISITQLPGENIEALADRVSQKIQFKAERMARAW